MRDKTSHACCLPFCPVTGSLRSPFRMCKASLLRRLRNVQDDNLRNNQIKNTNWYLWSFTSFGFCWLHRVP